jgi:hypothetical protein
MSAQADRDAFLEQQIDAACNRMIALANDDTAAREAFNEMARLIGQRSQTQILKMELERRLAIRNAK